MRWALGALEGAGSGAEDVVCASGDRLDVDVVLACGCCGVVDVWCGESGRCELVDVASSDPP